MNTLRSTTVALALFGAGLAATPGLALAETFASQTFSFIRGAVPGDFAGFYGGSLSGSFPVAQTEAEARASVLGAPDGRFTSLPGEPVGAPGTAFPGAYVEVGFGGDFGTHSLLRIYETGDNAERAQFFIWSNNGGNLQLTGQTNAAGVIEIDLSPYAGTLAGLGGTAWSKVGIGGLDRLGASQGFDLDAVSVAAIPEPSTYALMALGLLAVGVAHRRRARQA